MSQARHSRRSFLGTTTAALAAGAAASFGLRSGKRAEAAFQTPNERPHIGAVGAGGRGTSILKAAAKFGQVVAICDADLSHAEQAREAFGGTADVYQDYRELLDRQDIDVVINGTPDHWHTIINVAACRAGKDLYTEKPMTLTIDEGKILRRVVKQTGRVVQVGTQQRSSKQFQTAVELVRNGRIGKLREVWVALPYFSTKGGPFESSTPPTSLDWELYQGQAPVSDYCVQRTHKVFRWWYEYAGGIVTDWGNHHVDIAHWGMDCELTGPVSIDARGLFPNGGAPQCYNTPDRFFSRMVYPNGVPLLYFSALGEQLLYGDVQAHAETTPQEMEFLFGKDASEEIKTYNRNGIMFVGDQGRVFVNRGGLYGKPAEQLADNPLPDDAWRVRESDDHMGDFFACVKTREEPVSPVRVQQRTISACHLTNISLRLGRSLQWDPLSEQFVGDDEANRWLSREQRKPYTLTS